MDEQRKHYGRDREAPCEVAANRSRHVKGVREAGTMTGHRWDRMGFGCAGGFVLVLNSIAVIDWDAMNPGRLPRSHGGLLPSG